MRHEGRPIDLAWRMIDDPIVEEIHRIRDRMLAECGGDFGKYMDGIREAQEYDRD